MKPSKRESQVDKKVLKIVMKEKDKSPRLLKIKTSPSQDISSKS
jgi:hypothetical protein